MAKHTVRISATGHEVIEDLCQAFARLAISKPGTKEADDAHVAFQQRRLDTHTYIGSIERHQRVQQESFVIEVPGR